MVRILLAVVLERMLAQPVEGDAVQEAGGNDAIGVDVVEEKRDGGAGDGSILLMRFAFNVGRLIDAPAS